MSFRIIHGDCEKLLEADKLGEVDLTFLDPPFNQSKHYASHNDAMPEEEYWGWMGKITEKIYELTSTGGAIYFMQREKNTEHVLRCLRESGWFFQNLIIWKKMTSAVPSQVRYGKHYQIIAFATKDKKPRVFNKLRIDPPLLANYKQKRDSGIYVTDVWNDIRELTSGYFAGEEPLRENKERFHKQQSPVQLLLRIILSSSSTGDVVLDPFAGTGTTGVVAEQLHRDSISIELDPANVEAIKNRLSDQRAADNISQCREYYRYTHGLEKLWPCIGASSLNV